MNNQIIIQLIKREINELSLLVDALENTTSPRDVLIDVTKSKVETLSEVVNFLHKDTNNEPALDNQYPDLKNKSEKEIIQSLIEEKTDLNKEEEEEGEKITPSPEPAPVNKNNDTEKEAIETVQDQHGPANNENSKPAQNEEGPIEQNTAEQIEADDNEETGYTEDNTPQADKSQAEINNDKTNNKESKITSENKTFKKVLGDQFTKEKSLNEKFTSLSETKYKVMGKPVTSVKKAIGLNDRFMFTRELFNNDSGKFNDTVEAIDNANDLVEAVEYLEKNCEWPKNETSLKFMELVKRRFNN
jgi:hypothetical protein